MRIACKSCFEIDKKQCIAALTECLRASWVRTARMSGFGFERLTPLLDYLLPQYEQEGKAHLAIGIGCTGGRHRSVVVVRGKQCSAADLIVQILNDR